MLIASRFWTLRASQQVFGLIEVVIEINPIQQREALMGMYPE
ncbi:MAG: hypothetical protein V4632_23770 [Pseudomonadota bacterium]